MSFAQRPPLNTYLPYGQQRTPWVNAAQSELRAGQDEQTTPQPLRSRPAQQQQQQQPARAPEPVAPLPSTGPPPAPVSSDAAAAAASRDSAARPVLEAALAAEREQTSVLRRQHDKAQSSNARLLEELDASAKYASELKAQLELLTRRAGDAEAKVEQLSATAAAASRTRDELAAQRARADAAEAATADAQARAAHSEARVESYRTRLHECKARLRGSLQAQDDLAADNASLKTQTLSMLDTLRAQFLDVLTNWSEHIASLQQSEQRKSAQIATLQQTMQDYAREMEGTKIRIQQMHSSECEQAEHGRRRRQRTDQTERRHNNEDADTESVLREAHSRLGDSQPRPAPAAAAPSQSRPRGPAASADSAAPTSSYSALRHPPAVSPRSDVSSDSSLHASSSSHSAARSHAVDLLAQAEREAAEHARERMQRELRRTREQEAAREDRAREQEACARRKREAQEAEEDRYRHSRAAIRERAQGPSSCGAAGTGRTRCRSSERVSFAGEVDSPPSPCCCAHRSQSRSRSRGRSASRPRSSVPVGSHVGLAPARGGRSRSRSCGRGGGSGGRGRSRTLSPPRHYPAFLASAHSSYLHTHASSQKKCGPGAPACATGSSGGIGVLPSSFPERPCSGVAKHAPRAYLDAPAHSPRAAGGSRSFATVCGGGSKVATIYSYSATHGDALTSGLSSSRKRPIQDGTWQVTGVNTGRTDVIAGGRPSAWSGRSDEAKPTRTVTPPQHVRESKLKAGSADVPTAGVRTIIDELLGSPRSA